MLKKEITYDEFVYLFATTLIFASIAVIPILFRMGSNLGFIFLAIIAGVLVDGLRFAAGVVKANEFPVEKNQIEEDV